MSALSKRQAYNSVRLSLLPSVSSGDLLLRLRISIPQVYLDEPLLSRLTSDFGVIFNITAAKLEIETNMPGQFDLELRGTATQLRNATQYLQSLKIRLRGRPNVDGDSWYI